MAAAAHGSGRHAQLADPLTADDPSAVPPDDREWVLLEAECGRPAELAGLSGPELDALAAISAAAEPVPVAEVFAAGFLPRDGSGTGTGFANGGPLDVLAPGTALAWFADDAHARMTQLTDDELIGVLRAWRRETSWAQAREAAVVTELARRRPPEGFPQVSPGQVPAVVSEFLAAEVAAALTLTGVAAGALTGLSLDLAARPATAAALAQGRIDLPRARVLLSGLACLPGPAAAAVEAAALSSAGELTTGQLRARVARLVLAADPAAARARREQAEQQARVDCWADPEGTATLAGRYLPPAEVLAADTALSALARAWQAQLAAAWQARHGEAWRDQPGARPGLDLLRARGYLALLLGQPTTSPPADLLPPADSGPAAGPGQDQACPADQPGPAHQDQACPADQPGPAHHDQPAPAAQPGAGGQPAPAGLRLPDPSTGPGGLPPLAGQVHLTLPLATLLGWSDAPGEAAGYGPLDGYTARDLARAAAGPGTRWHLTLTDPAGRALAHGCAAIKTSPPGQDGRWTFTITLDPIQAGSCDHAAAEPGYRPSSRLTHLTCVRTTTCGYPGCRRPATRCDCDHTQPYHQGGRTCPCNLHPLCRHHHRLKHSPGWTLRQPTPGTLTWTTPAGRHYTTRPTQHPI